MVDKHACTHGTEESSREREKSRPIRIHAALDHSASAKDKSPEQVGRRRGGGVWEKGNGRGRKKQMNRLWSAAILILGRVAHLRQNTETEVIFCDLLCSKPFQTTQVVN